MAAAIRPAADGEAESLAEVARTTFTETFGHLYDPADLSRFLTGARAPSIYESLLDDDTSLVLVSEEGGRIVGYAVSGPCKLPVADLEDAAGEVKELYVLESHQGLGIGTRLLEASLDWLVEQGRSPLYVGVWSENHGAQRLYGRYGFQKVGEYDFPVGNHIDREFILEQAG